MTNQRLPSGQLQSEHVRNIAKDLILAILTCGLYNIYVQSQQIKALNAMLREDKYSFVHWFLLCLITCGIYHFYHEYRVTQDLCILMKLDSNEALLSIILCFFGLSLIVDAIQQTHINRYYGATGL